MLSVVRVSQSMSTTPAMAAGVVADDAVVAGSRFDSSHAQGKLYRDRYWNDAYLDALAEIHRSCGGHGLDAVFVALRRLIHHSQLNPQTQLCQQHQTWSLPSVMVILGRTSTFRGLRA
jgi:hypothetical protein